MSEEEKNEIRKHYEKREEWLQKNDKLLEQKYIEILETKPKKNLTYMDIYFKEENVDLAEILLSITHCAPVKVLKFTKIDEKHSTFIILVDDKYFDVVGFSMESY